MIFVSWLIKRLVDPAALLWLGLIFLFLFQIRRKHYLEASIVGGFVFLLTVFGGTTVSDHLTRGLESPYFSEEPMSVSEADVVLVLGGHLSLGAGEPHGFDSGESIDRLLAGVELVRAGKGKLLLMGGGAAGPSQASEFSVIEPWVSSWNLLDVPLEHIGLCANTFEEAKAVKLLVDSRGWSRVILVTSALHMKRAEGVFRSAGVPVIPVACDFRSFPLPPAYLIPSARRLRGLGAFLNERIGWAYYRSRGWITD
ncbi:YdcF family protein [Verrucomicrobia bacterium]|nr:YdcF family protein [Verrucomicrobiota bacterium]MDA7657340.1 YdcF family protein [Verrucomicrobiota bacterium]